MPLSRRTFLAGSAAAFGFKNETLDRMAALPFAPNDAEDEEFWMRIRGEFNIDPNLTSFNHAGLSPSPRTVLETIASEWKRANVAPSFMIWRKQDYELDTVRKQLAEIVGCKTEQLALTMNATYGLQTAILGVPMSAGDEILATEHEYSRALTAMDQRGRRDGVVAVVLPLKAPPENQEEVAKQILAAVTDKTKLILLSQMTFLAGTKMPIRLVANALKGRDIPILVDGAHGIGLLPDQFSEQGGDIYTACLHKWMMCTIGTGVFVATQPWIRQMWPLHPAEDNLNDSITKFEQIGSRPAAPFLAIKDALAFHNLIG